jgi:integrase/recombinase XerD
MALHRIFCRHDPEPEYASCLRAGGRPVFAGCERHRIHSLEQVKPVVVPAYIEKHPGSAPTLKQHLAAIRMLFDFLVIGQIVPVNPAASVRGPKHVVRKGKTPVLRADPASQLLDSVETGSVVGLRDRAVIGLICYTFARVSAMIRMRVAAYYEDGKRGYASTRKAAAGTRCRATTMQSRILSPISMPPASVAKRNRRSSGAWTRRVTANPMARTDVLRMITRRAEEAGLPSSTCCHTFRATGIIAYLENGGMIENAQAIAAHESPRTTTLYDRTGDEITLDELERILI